MILVVDVGNSRIKAAVFEENKILEIFIFTKIELEKKIENILKKFQKVSDLVISSVGDVDKQAILAFASVVNVNFISNTNAFPFENKYSTPKTLGIDRMVLAAGAVLTFPNQNRLVIDAGTCVTYDFIDKENN